MTRDLNQLAKEIYEANKAKGFHEEKQSYEHMMCLVISELMEAVEADRKGRKADFENFNKQYEYSFKDNFEEYIKDTVEDELADAAIRLLDTAGELELKLNQDNLNEIANAVSEEKVLAMKFTECIHGIVFVIVNASYCDQCSTVESIEGGLAIIIGYCKALNIDLWKHVELKLKYNSLRPYKHGKAY